ncbi:hypothetical protein A2982_02635 [candidate division WWE3 bacterium RIFCSPLOWO2_01_FULL_39_13]|uniref:Inorganic pyrophosphatase n=1 Tax=candidate division WWE3 bacterium RIFCSPLOWO2_01_FULL_39_13 TaxID=1802624 RepID=A0A1F4V2N8_UNCKA|nr:MAG: hypothetical protein A2982_02635 [candidate division WWE3 bacterium RIFCSPLOWO2_01_FULL_39_13]
MNLFHGIKQDKAPQVLKLVSEIAKGDFVKYEYNNEYGVLEVDRILYGPVHYPVVYADVPRTWNTHDGDPLDAVVYTTGNIVPGAIVHGRVVGLMGMLDNNEEDSKIICVNDRDPRYSHVNGVKDLPEYELKDLQTFMETYKYAQTGPGTVKITGFKDKEEAYKLIEWSMKEYEKKFKDQKRRFEPPADPAVL